MHVLNLTTGYADYWQLPGWVRDHGSVRAPRGKLTYDAGPTTLVFSSPYDALAVDCGRGLSRRVAAAEALQLIGAASNPTLTNWASPNFRAYQEDDGVFWGAYGQRIGQQLHHVVEKIREDPSTRQAVITLWDPDYDNVPGKRDYPCTVALNLALVSGKLELRALMRSNDVWLGLPYDIFQFTQLQLTAASALRVPPGPYTHTTWSLHLYHEHAEKARELHAPPPMGEDCYDQPVGMPTPMDAIEYAVARARRLMNRDLHHALDLSYTEWWYHESLKGWYRDAGVVG